MGYKQIVGTSLLCSVDGQDLCRHVATPTTCSTDQPTTDHPAKDDSNDISNLMTVIKCVISSDLLVTFFLHSVNRQINLTWHAHTHIINHTTMENLWERNQEKLAIWIMKEQKSPIGEVHASSSTQIHRRFENIKHYL